MRTHGTRVQVDLAAVPTIESSGDSDTEDDDAPLDISRIVFSSVAYPSDASVRKH